MEASSVVVTENIELKKEEVKNNNNNNKSKNKSNGNTNNNKKEAVVADSANGEVTNAAAIATTDSSAQKKKKTRRKKSNTRIQVSNTKKPFSFYLNLAKSYIKQYNNVELSALGMAIPTVITIAEILKRDGLANSKEVKISTVDSKEDHRGSFIQKPKIQIVLGKAENLNKTTTDDAAAPKIDSDNKEA